ncbi:MAG: hypothetical protein FWH52_06435 [Synergistaceae bacterium]|nr:hypothetical protein [Synergistaceae bacterium]
MNGEIYAITTGSSVVDVFNPLTKTWRVVASRPNTVSINGMKGMDGKLYLFGSDGVVYCYDPVQNSWISNNIRYAPQFVVPAYQDFYFLYTNYYYEFKNIERYSPADNTVTNYNSFLHGYDSFYQVCDFNNKAYIFAGQGYTSGAEILIEYMPSISPGPAKHPHSL